MKTTLTAYPNPAHRSRLAIAAFCLGLISFAVAQNPSDPSLGDVARQTRKEHSEPGHVPGKTLVNDEEDGPDSTGIWRLRSCTLVTTCYEVSITLPKSPRWIRQSDEPRPVLIPLQAHEEDLNHALRIYAAESVGPNTSPDIARRVLLQSWFARPEYFGQSARLVQDEHTTLYSNAAVITHFTIGNNPTQYHGVSVIVNAYNVNHGFACVYRDEDESAAASICDAIIKSAQNAWLSDPPKRPAYPRYRKRPQHYYPENPREDPPEDDDP